MLLVDAAELAEELARLRLQVPGQGAGREIHFLQLNLRRVVLVELEDDVRDALEVGIDGSVEEDLLVRQREATLERVVVAALDCCHVRRRRPAKVHERVEGEIQVSTSPREKRDRLRRGPGLARLLRGGSGRRRLRGR